MARLLILLAALLTGFGLPPPGAAAPANNNFASAFTLTGPAGVTNGSNVSATKESSEPDHAGNAGGRSIWYRWTAPTDLTVTFSTAGSKVTGSTNSLDTLLAIYTGSTLATLEEAASDDDGNGDGTSRAVFVATAGTTYRIAVDGFDGAAGNVVLTWTTGPPNDLLEFAQVLEGVAGTVHGLNAGASTEAGEPLHAGVAGGRSIWFAWTAWGDGTVMFSTAGSSFDTVLATYTGLFVDELEVVAANDDDNGTNTSAVNFRIEEGQTYLIAVDGKGGAAGEVMLGWALALAPPANDAFASPQDLVGIAGQVQGSSIGATQEPGEANPVGIMGGASVWFQWTASDAEVVTFDTAGSDFDTVLVIYVGSDLASAIPVAGNDNDGTNLTSRVSFSASAGTGYRLAVDGKGGAQGRYSLRWLTSSAVSANDYFTNAQALGGLSGSVTGATVLASRESGEPNHAGNAGGRSIWYRWLAPASVRMTFATEESNFDTLLAVYRGTNVATLNPVANNNDIAPGNRASRVTFSASAGTTYQVAVDGVGGAGGTVRLSWTALPPSIASFTPTNGIAGLSVVIAGQGFFGATSVRFGGVPASFVVNADDRISAGVPGSALSGPISVITPAGTGTSAEAFVIPLPRLGIRPVNAAQVLLSWPGTPSGFSLQYLNPDGGTGGWANVAAPPVIVGSERFFTNNTTGAHQWFRLRR